MNRSRNFDYSPPQTNPSVAQLTAFGPPKAAVLLLELADKFINV